MTKRRAGFHGRANIGLLAVAADGCRVMRAIEHSITVAPLTRWTEYS